MRKPSPLDRTNQISFTADPDVKRMMDAARAADLKIKPLCNEALRIYLPKRGFNIKKGKASE